MASSRSFIASADSGSRKDRRMARPAAPDFSGWNWQAATFPLPMEATKGLP